MTRLTPALLLAVTATGTAVCMSVLASWQRGRWLSERLVWIAIGIVLVISAHLLPTLARPAPLAVRCVGSMLWLGCLASASYGHATFFILSQVHAGEVRASAVSVTPIPTHRDLTTITRDRAVVTTQLAEAQASHCTHHCPALRARRISLAAQLDMLNTEAMEAQRYQTLADISTTRRNSARSDPVTRLAAPTGWADTRFDLLIGLTLAAILEGTACLLWWLALHPGAEAKPIVLAPQNGTAEAKPLIDLPAEPSCPVMQLDDEVTKLRHAIDGGLVKPTVSGIRQHLRCSQAKASALRKSVLHLL